MRLFYPSMPAALALLLAGIMVRDVRKTHDVAPGERYRGKTAYPSALAATPREQIEEPLQGTVSK